MQPGDVLGDRYRIEERIATGGMADVFSARDRRLDRNVAVKVFRSSQETDLDRFAAEVRLLARLRHANLVQLYDGGTEHGVPYAVLELVDGPTLAHRLRSGPLPASDAVRIGRDLADALAYVHAHGVVHRDVKPSNVLLDRSGRALLGDFGIARIAGSTRLTSTSMTIGTGMYMAPEQLSGDDVTPAADVYALGLVLVECLTAAPPFPGTLEEALVARLTRPPEIPRDTDPALRARLQQMTARAAADRPSARDVADALDAGGWSAAPATTERAAAVTAPTAVMPAPAPADAPRPRRARGVLVVALLAVLGVVAVVAAAALGDGDDPVLVGATSAPAAPATTAATTVAPTAPPATDPVTTVPATDAVAAQCAQLEARKAALEDEKRELGQIYRDDKDARDARKDEIDAEREAIDEQLHALEC